MKNRVSNCIFCASAPYYVTHNPNGKYSAHIKKILKILLFIMSKDCLKLYLIFILMMDHAFKNISC